jgi:hypothetical protein
MFSTMLPKPCCLVSLRVLVLALQNNEYKYCCIPQKSVKQLSTIWNYFQSTLVLVSFLQTGTIQNAYAKSSGIWHRYANKCNMYHGCYRYSISASASTNFGDVAPDTVRHEAQCCLLPQEHEYDPLQHHNQGQPVVTSEPCGWCNNRTGFEFRAVIITYYNVWVFSEETGRWRDCGDEAVHWEWR